MRISDWSSDVCSSDLLGLAGFDFIFGYTVGFQLLDRVVRFLADVAHGHAPFFGLLLYFPYEVAAALFGERRDVEPDDVTVILGCQSAVGIEDGFFNGCQHRDRKSTRLNSRN